MKRIRVPINLLLILLISLIWTVKRIIFPFVPLGKLMNLCDFRQLSIFVVIFRPPPPGPYLTDLWILLCTTATVQNYVVHHRPALCTMCTDLRSALWCTGRPNLLRSSSHPKQFSFLSPPVHFARWAHMCHFLSVRPDWTKNHWIIIHISKSIMVRNLKLHHIVIHVIDFNL